MTVSSDERPAEPVSTWWLVLVSSFWFTSSYKWFLLLVFLLPDQVARIVPGGEKSAYWGLIFGVGALWDVVGHALFGDLSDRLGDRRWFVLGGSILTAAALVILFRADAIWMLAAGYVLLQVADGVSAGPYGAVLPEMVPKRQRGRASGVMGAAMSLSQVAAVLTALGFAGAGVRLYGAIGALSIGAALLAFPVLQGRRREVRIDRPYLQGWIEPWRNPAFRWVWLTRFLVTLGFYFVIPYANFYVRDVVSDYRFFGYVVSSPDIATGVLALVVAVSAAVGSLVAGPLIDRVGRKRLTYIGAALMAAGLLGMAWLPGLTGLVGLVFAMGAGQGAFQAANWALVSDVLPDRDALGRDMGIWQMSNTSVQVFAGAAGLIVMYGNRVHFGLGYQMLFMLATLVVAAGAAATSRIGRVG